QNTSILQPISGNLNKWVVYVPASHLDLVRNSLFAAGAGHIGNYSECSFHTEGTGTFSPGTGTQPYSGREGIRSEEPEYRLEMLVPEYKKGSILKALLSSHPYEEPAYDIIPLHNSNQDTGAGLIGELPEAIPFEDFLAVIKKNFNTGVIRYTNGPDLIRRIAVCGGSGSFLTRTAI